MNGSTAKKKGPGTDLLGDAYDLLELVHENQESTVANQEIVQKIKRSLNDSLEDVSCLGSQCLCFIIVMNLSRRA